MLATATNAVNVSMESWTTTSDRGDGTGQVRTYLLVILMCLNIIFLLYVLNFYYLGSKVVEKLESIIESRQMKMDIRMPFPRLQTANLEAYHSLIDHFAIKMNEFSYQGMQSRQE